MSDIFILTLNFLLYLFTFFYFLKKRNFYSPISFLTFFYAVVSSFAIIWQRSTPIFTDLSVIGFLYLFIIIFIFVKPLDSSYLEINQFPRVNVGLYKSIALIYIILSFFSCIYYLPDAISGFSSQNWSDIYADSHEAQASSLAEKLINLSFHLRTLGMVMFVYFSSFHKKNFVFNILLGIMAFLPSFLVSISHASRGGIIDLFASIFFLYVIFKNVLSRKIVKVFIAFFSIVVPIAIVYFLAVTFSRFSDSSGIDPFSSMTEYLGQSMIVFDSALFNKIQQFSHGEFMFNSGQISRCTSSFLLNNYYGANFGSYFFTFVGSLLFDFGLFGTFLFALIFSKFIRIVISRKALDIPDLMLIFYYLTFIFHGVFVQGRGYGVQWVEIIILFFILKFIQKIKI